MASKIRCSDCKHNPMGTCELCGKEIPMAYVLDRINKNPGWCPLNRSKK